MRKNQTSHIVSETANQVRFEAYSVRDRRFSVGKQRPALLPGRASRMRRVSTGGRKGRRLSLRLLVATRALVTCAARMVLRRRLYRARRCVTGRAGIGRAARMVRRDRGRRACGGSRCGGGRGRRRGLGRRARGRCRSSCAARGMAADTGGVGTASMIGRQRLHTIGSVTGIAFFEGAGRYMRHSRRAAACSPARCRRARRLMAGRARVARPAGMIRRRGLD